MTHQCSFCLKQFDFASKLQRHSLIHTGQRPFACLLCGKAFRQSAHLKKHLECHTKLNPVSGSTAESDCALTLGRTSQVDQIAYGEPARRPDSSPQQSCLFEETDHLLQTVETRSITKWDEAVSGFSGEQMEYKTQHGSSFRPSPAYPSKLHPYFDHSEHNLFEFSSRGKPLRQTSHLNSCCLGDKGTDNTEQRAEPDSFSPGDGNFQTGSCPDLISSTAATAESSIDSHPKLESPDWPADKGWSLSRQQQSLSMDHKHAEDSPAQQQTSGLTEQNTDKCDMLASHSRFKDDHMSQSKESFLNPLPDMTPSISCLVLPEKLQIDHNEAQGISSENVVPVTPPQGTQPEFRSKESTIRKDAYQCSTCRKCFSAPSKLRRHVLIHTGQRPFACHICTKAFRQLAHLKFHLTTHLSQRLKKQRISKVNGVSRSYLSADDAVAGVSLSAERTQNSSFGTEANMFTLHPNPMEGVWSKENMLYNKEPSEPRQSLVGGPEERTVGGRACSTEAKKDRCWSTNVTEIFRKSATSRIVHECPVCFKCFSAPSKLRRHCLIHTGQRPFQCYICHRAFRQLAHLKAHYAVHTGPVKRRPFSRHRVSIMSQSQRHLPVKSGLTHTVGSTYGKQSGYSNNQNTEQQNQQNSPTGHHGLTDHQDNKNTDLLTTEVSRAAVLTSVKSVPKENSISECESGTVKIKGPKGDYWCPVCAKCFTAPSKLWRHFLIHGGQRPFKCQVCLRAFRQRSHLKVHRCTPKSVKETPVPSLKSGQQSVHTAKEVIQSQDCPDSSRKNDETLAMGSDHLAPFSSPKTDVTADHSSTVRLTIKRPDPGQHEDPLPDLSAPVNKSSPILSESSNFSTNGTRVAKEKGYQCMICLKVFDFPSKLSRHLLIHMGIKPFLCKVCGKSFRQLCHLQSHLKVHAGKRKDENRRFAWINRRKSTPCGGESVPGDPAPPEGETEHACNSDLRSAPPKSELDSNPKDNNHNQDGLPYLCSKEYDQEVPTHYTALSDFVGESPAKYTVHQRENNSSLTHCLPLSLSHGSMEHKRDNRTDSVGEQLPPTNEVKQVPKNSSKQNGVRLLKDYGVLGKQENQARNVMTSVNPLAPESAPKQSKASTNQCMVCMKTFDFPSKLSRHLLIHTDIKPYKCQICPKSFRQLSHLQTHSKVHKGNAKSVATDRSSQQSTVSRRDAAASDDLAPLPDLHQERYDVNPNGVPAAQDQETKIEDISSQACKVEQQNLNYQRDDAEPSLSCIDSSDYLENVKGEIMKSETSIEADEKWVQSPSRPETSISNCDIEKPFHTYVPDPQLDLHPGPCSFENKTEDVHLLDTPETYQITNRQEDDLVRSKIGSKGSLAGWDPFYQVDMSADFHPESEACMPKEEGLEERTKPGAHLTGPPNDHPICPGCSQCFTSEKQLRSHRCPASVSEERLKSSYLCAICFKSFEAPSKLKRHYLIHTGQRPFQCAVCPKAFTQSAHLKTHMLTHR